MWVHFHNNEVSTLEQRCFGLLGSSSQLLQGEAWNHTNEYTGNLPYKSRCCSHVLFITSIIPQFARHKSSRE